MPLCGFVHDLSPIPDNGWLSIRNWEYEEVIRAEKRVDEISNGLAPKGDSDPRESERGEMTRVIVSKTSLLYECPKCGRLMWQKPGDVKYCVYRTDASS